MGTEAKGTIPHVLFMAYQGTFAIITAALISGAIVERMRFGPYLAFIVLWTLFVYAPVAHWVWGGGWLMTRGVLDFAGGTVVHINAGVVRAGRRPRARRAARTTAGRPSCRTTCPSCCSAPGCSGSAGSASTAAARWPPTSSPRVAFTNTFLAPMATLVVWVLLDYFRTGRATAVGGATGIVIGLVAITPAAGFVSPMSALLLGAIAAFPSYFAIVWRSRTRLDDSLDVFAGHGIGGITGALLTGVFASKAWNPAGTDGLLGGQPGAARHAGARRAPARSCMRRSAPS